MGGHQAAHTAETSRRDIRQLLPTGSLTLGWLRSLAVSPVAWVSAFALAAVAPAAAVVSTYGSLVFGDADGIHALRDLTWLGSVAAILSSLAWLPRATGLADSQGHARAWLERAHLLVTAGLLGAGLAHAWTLVDWRSIHTVGLAQHVAAVLHVAGFAMLILTLPIVRRGAVWVLLGAIVVACLAPSSGLGVLVGVEASAVGTWLTVAGLWIASAPSLAAR